MDEHPSTTSFTVAEEEYPQFSGVSFSGTNLTLAPGSVITFQDSSLSTQKDGGSSAMENEELLKRLEYWKNVIKPGGSVVRDPHAAVILQCLEEAINTIENLEKRIETQSAQFTMFIDKTTNNIDIMKSRAKKAESLILSVEKNIRNPTLYAVREELKKIYVK